MTAQQIVDAAKLYARQQSGGVPDATWLAFLNLIQPAYLRMDNWPEMLTQGATLSIVANTSSYALPAAFSRPAGDYCWYGVSAVTGGYQNGTPIPIIRSGAGFGDANIQAFSMIAPTSGYPAAVAFLGSTAQFYPATLTGSLTMLYNYFREPDALTLGATTPVATLDQTFIMALAKEICRYMEQWDLYGSFEKDERRQYHMAVRTLLTK